MFNASNKTNPVIVRSGRIPATALAVMAMAALAGGCATYPQDATTTGSIPDDYRSRHPIVVSQSETSEDIIVSANARQLSLRDKQLTQSFAARFKRSGATGVAIMIPSGSPNASAARRIAADVARVMQHEGIPAGRIRILHYSAKDHGDAATVRMVYSDITASVPSQCGQWYEQLLDTWENRNYENFGCATQKNLAAMVANPADLVGPRGETDIDATRRTNVIQNWQVNGTNRLGDLF